MVKVKIGDTEIEASVTPIIVTAEKTYSRQIIVFYVNGVEYFGYVSQGGKLVVNKTRSLK